MRRLAFVINKPTPVYGSKDTEQTFTYMSILKQCVLLNDQRSRVSMYRLADSFDFNLTHYISCTADLG